MALPIVEQHLRINSYESDLNANIKAVSLQNLLQEVAYRGSEFCKCGPSVMKDRGIFWALNRIHFHIYDYPRWEDDVVLQTWSRGQAGPLWHRNFRMLKGGQVSVLGTSAWTVVDLKERSIYRGDLGFDPTRILFRCAARSSCQRTWNPFPANPTRSDGPTSTPTGTPITAHTPSGCWTRCPWTMSGPTFCGMSR